MAADGAGGWTIDRNLDHRTGGGAILQRHLLGRRVVRFCNVAHIRLPVVTANHETLHALGVETSVVRLKRLPGTASHLRDQIVRLERGDIPRDDYGADLRTRSFIDVEGDNGAPLFAHERRFRVNPRLEVTGAMEKVLDRRRAVFDSVVRKNIAGVERQLAAGPIAITRTNAFEMDVAHSVIDEEGERHGQAGRRRCRLHANVAKVSGGVQTLDR